LYEVQSTKYKVRSTKYEVQSTKYKVPSTKYDVPSRLRGKSRDTRNVTTALCYEIRLVYEFSHLHSPIGVRHSTLKKVSSSQYQVARLCTKYKVRSRLRGKSRDTRNLPAAGRRDSLRCVTRFVWFTNFHFFILQSAFGIQH
jgi:hypothetical protein